MVGALHEYVYPAVIFLANANPHPRTLCERRSLLSHVLTKRDS
jgi:hypothetical protein